MRQVNQLFRITLKSALVFALLASVSFPRIQAERTGTPSIAEQYLLSAANQERSSRGLTKLSWDPVLARAAAFHAGQMADHGGISHEFPGEPDLSARGANAGVRFSLISENVAEAPDSIMIHDMWMHSEGHRANLLDPNVNIVGISVTVRDQQLYAVEDFASAVETLSLNQQESTVTSLLTRSGLSIANNDRNSIEDARQTCAMPSGHAGTRKPWFIMRYTASSLSELPSELKSRLSTGKYHQALVGACSATDVSPFSAYNIAVLLYP